LFGREIKFVKSEISKSRQPFMYYIKYKIYTNYT
jgi:hypothetical protein